MNPKNKGGVIPQDKNDPKWWKYMGELENSNSDNDNNDDEEEE